VCDACQKGKITRASFKPKKYGIYHKTSGASPHLNLFGPSRPRSIGGNYYRFVIVDDYSRFTWALFLASKDDLFYAFAKFAKIIQNQNSLKIVSLVSDHGGEFVNDHIEDFCDEFDISHNFYCPWAPQQNRVVKIKKLGFGGVG